MVLSRNRDAGSGTQEAGSGKREKRGELILAAHPGLMVVLTTVVLRS